MSPIQTLTACLDDARYPETARALFGLALDTIRARGLATQPTVASFLLPSELLAAHLGTSSQTVWRNLKPLRATGLLNVCDHQGTFSGDIRVTGKAWAVCLRPEAQIDKRAGAAKVTKENLNFSWRDLDADIKIWHTVYLLIRTEEQQALDAERSARQKPQQAKARADKAGGEPSS